VTVNPVPFSFNRANSGVFNFLFIGHNTLTIYFYLMGLNNNCCIGVVEQRKKNLPKFYLSTKQWLQTDTRTCASFLSIQRTLNVPRLGQYGNSVNELVLYEVIKF
jgi:hypothetical protein